MVFKFTIDKLTNRYVLPNLTGKLPAPIARFLGNHKATPKDDYLIWLEILVASFCGIALLEGLGIHHTVFTDHSAPIIIASYGATAILCFNSITAPLAQPRNILIGHFVSSLLGICVQKLFSLSHGGREHYWASGALSVGISSVAMSILNCVHPPAGASALLPSIDEEIRKMSWWYLPLQIISSLLIIVVACLTGNVIRSYPTYWWTPNDVGKPKEAELKPVEPTPAPPSKVASGNESIESSVVYLEEANSIIISRDEIIIPKNLNIEDIDVSWLLEMKSRLEKTEPLQSVGV
ncbi:hypothetical protein HYPBUDRAFT_153527 [Hyphopichia burtonii NRRL Y-1933]|uniref:HPP transmembrane region domain-containing protein n=1 Tax=Hyphopichia burtonii NRRL Y-1933 TaxID=984485 RepID=A0A1E4RFC3_9ASCO|nr:hypothetical protein HYPBUDRAFT_153527 [Hyphopichia burtonii NRRL Y-1933]ODV65950.1 hypothetical protein HYPBUDRAFT_153527 [Hyphopichia burtonii NRRL Y-1933]